MESFYNFALYTNTFLMVAICISLPTKCKYDVDGKIKHKDSFLLRCIVTTSSGLWILFHSIIIFIGVSVGSKSIDFEQGIEKITYCGWREHWLPLLLMLICMYVFATYKLCQIGYASDRRMSILFFIKKYPSPEISLEKVEKCCKVNQLKLFPILRFRDYLKKVGELSQDEDNNGKAFNNMLSDMEELKKLERLSKSYNTDRNFETLWREGAFS